MLASKSNGFEDTGREISRVLFDPLYRPVVPIADNEFNRSFTDRTIEITIQEGIDAGAKEYGKRNSGVNLLERRVNRKGYELLGEGNATQAIGVFRLNVLAFPGSSNAYDSLGEAHLEGGDTTQAIENYRKSLALDPANAHAEEVLKRLLEK